MISVHDVSMVSSMNGMSVMVLNFDGLDDCDAFYMHDCLDILMLLTVMLMMSLIL